MDRELEKECEERNQISKAYIKQCYGVSMGPRRRHHWEVRCGELCLVEE